MKKLYLIFAVLTLLILTSCSVSPPAQTPPEQTPIPIKEDAVDYAWVLVDTVDYGMCEEEIERIRQEAYYEFEGSASQGNFSAKITYSGQWIWRDSIQASFSTPPNTIRAGETVTLSFSMIYTEHKFPSGRTRVYTYFDLSYGIVGAGLGEGVVTQFKNKNGESVFQIAHGYRLDPRDDVLSLSETISATAPSGGYKGDKITIHILFVAGIPMGTRYIYEWRAQ